MTGYNGNGGIRQEIAEIQSSVNKIEKKEQFVQKYVFQLVTIIFLAGGGWMTLNNIQALAEENKASIEKVKQEEQARDSKSEYRLTRLETRQEEILKNQDEQNHKLDEILKELRNK